MCEHTKEKKKTFFLVVHHLTFKQPVAESGLEGLQWLQMLEYSINSLPDPNIFVYKASYLFSGKISEKGFGKLLRYKPGAEIPVVT